tara:strand:- start:131 stop:718 length:588 start_codon:yes stop_codon:yes gene_type:complete
MITLKEIRDNEPCEDSWTKLLKSFNKTKADDTVVTCEYLLDTLDVDDTLWVISNCIGGKRVKKRHMVADIAKRVLHFWEDWAKDNAPDHLNAPRKAVEAVRSGKVDDEILRAALAAATDVSPSARNAATDVSTSARNVYNAYWAASAAGAAGAAGALAARHAAWAARHAAWAASAAAADAEQEEQKKIILKYFGE